MARKLMAFFVALALLGSACSSKPSLVGAWTGNLQVQGTKVDMEFTFGKDGKASFKQSAMEKTSVQYGAYVEKEGSFTFTPTSILTSALSKEMLKQLNDEIANKKQPVDFTLNWKDADTISILQNGAPAPLNVFIELKRKK